MRFQSFNDNSNVESIECSPEFVDIANLLVEAPAIRKYDGPNFFISFTKFPLYRK